MEIGEVSYLLSLTCLMMVITVLLQTFSALTRLGCRKGILSLN